MTIVLDQWLKQAEGLRLTPYTDTHGFLTCGYGHNLTANGISIAVAEQMLAADIATAQHEVLTALPWVANIDQPRQDAIFHLCFWIGIGSLLGFKNMLAAVQGGEWQTASNELLNSDLARDIPERANAISQRLLTGDSP